jgi:hypothetical protein
MSSRRGNINGRLKAFERELTKTIAYTNDNHSGFALSGPGATAGFGFVSQKNIEHLKARGAYIHVLELVRSGKAGAPHEDDLGTEDDLMSTRGEIDAHNASLEAWWPQRITRYDLLLRGEALPGASPAEEAELLLDALLEVASEEFADPFDKGIVISEEARHPDRLRDGFDRLLRLLDTHPHVLLTIDLWSLLELTATQHHTPDADSTAAPPAARAAFEVLADAGGAGAAGACVEPRAGTGLGPWRGNRRGRRGGPPRARGALGPPRAAGRGAALRRGTSL